MCIPRGPQKTTNVVEFYYPEEIALFEREFVEAERAAYMETAREDDEIAERMDAVLRGTLTLPDRDACRAYAASSFAWPHIAQRVRKVLAQTV